MKLKNDYNKRSVSFFIKSLFPCSRHIFGFGGLFSLKYAVIHGLVDNHVYSVSGTTYIIHLLFEAGVDFIAFRQSRLKLVELLTVQRQLLTDEKTRKSD